MNSTVLKSLLIRPDTTMKQAMQKLTSTGEKILFVVSRNNKLLGTLTDGDIRKKIIMGMKLNHNVEEIMQTNFTFVKDDDLQKDQKSIHLMKQKKIDQIPVLNSEGIIKHVISWVDYIENSFYKTPNNSFSVVIMAGGKGTRLDPFTRILPKPLIPLNNKPIIEHIMDKFYENGFHHFYLVINYKKEIIKMYVNENQFPYKIDFIEEKEYLGTAGGLSLLKDIFNDTVIVTNCDTILDGDYTDIIKWHKERNNIVSIVGTHKEITVPYGVLNMAGGNLDKIEEKPRYDLFINTGFYIFEPDVFKFVRKNQYTNMDIFLNTIKHKYENRIGVYPHWGKWFDIGQWDEYRKSLQFLDDNNKNLSRKKNE